jgi:hypothetical protein
MSLAGTPPVDHASPARAGGDVAASSKIVRADPSRSIVVGTQEPATSPPHRVVSAGSAAAIVAKKGGQAAQGRGIPTEIFAGTSSDVYARFLRFTKSDAGDHLSGNDVQLQTRMQEALLCCAKHNPEALPSVFPVLLSEYMPHASAAPEARMRMCLQLLDALGAHHGEEPTKAMVAELCKATPGETRVHASEIEAVVGNFEYNVKYGIEPWIAEPLLKWAPEASLVSRAFPLYLVHRAGIPLRPIPDAAWVASPSDAVVKVRALVDLDLATLEAYAKDGTCMAREYDVARLPASMLRGLAVRAKEIWSMAKESKVPDLPGVATELERYLTTKIGLDSGELEHAFLGKDREEIARVALEAGLSAALFAGSPSDVHGRLLQLSKSDIVGHQGGSEANLRFRMENILRSCAEHNLPALQVVFQVVISEYMPCGGALPANRVETLMRLLTIHADASGEEKVKTIVQQLRRADTSPAQVFFSNEGEALAREGLKGLHTKDRSLLRWKSEVVDIASSFPRCIAHRAGVPPRPLPDPAMFADPSRALEKVKAFIADDLASLRAHAKDGSCLYRSYGGDTFSGPGIAPRALALRDMANEANLADRSVIEAELRTYAETNTATLIKEARAR